MDKFLKDEDKATAELRAALLTKNAEKEMNAWDKQYQYDFSYTHPSEPLEATNVLDLVEFARAGKCEIDARILTAQDGARGLTHKSFDTKQFVEAFYRNTKNEGAVSKFLESSHHRMQEGFDAFDFSGGGSGIGDLVGQDFISFLGGPFDKQLYIQDYLKMHGTAFMTYHHDPIAHRCVQLKKEFTLGRGFRVDMASPAHKALWRAFEDAADIQELFGYIGIEYGLYGEVMLWRLPDHQKYVQYKVYPGQESPKVILPRYRLIDPSAIWEIVTFPEDITRVLYYKWIAPTQYQLYTDKVADKPVPTTKFIFQEIPADQVRHFKTNCVSNEKRGRSDLFPSLGYFKRLRDAVNYSIIGDQKTSAWAIDTTIDGSQTDIDSYIEFLKQMATIAPAGSDFVHSNKVVRQYLANHGGGSRRSVSFEWALSMICGGQGIPVSYLGTHLSGGQTRASAMVGTEPSAKMFEGRQLDYERMIRAIARDLFISNNLDPNIDIEVTFPEIITQDRSAKLKDLSLAVQERWISSKRAAEIAAKEFNITEFDYETEQKDIDKHPEFAPLTVGSMEPTPDAAHSDIDSESRAEVRDEDT